MPKTPPSFDVRKSGSLLAQRRHPREGGDQYNAETSGGCDREGTQQTKFWWQRSTRE